MTDYIVPPPELVQQWVAEFYGTPIVPGEACTDLAARAAQWGADQELEACCEWIVNGRDHELSAAYSRTISANLRAARRPKPPSLKEEALAELAEWENVMDIASDSPIRRALEALPE
jgi:hypothetical protein